MRRIFIVGYSENKGGVESYITNLCGQIKDNFEIILSLPKMRIDGVDWIRPKNRHNIFKYYSFWTKFFKQNHFDALYYNTCDIVSIDMLKFAKDAKIPIRIIHSHNAGNQMAIQKKMNICHRIIEQYNKKHIEEYATHLLACSEKAGEWMFGQKSFNVIKNGILLSKYAFSLENRIKLRNKYGYTDEKIVGIIGRLDYQKNPFFAVNVLEKWIAEASNISAVFIGEGQLKESVEQEVEQRGLSHRIKFIGGVNNINEWMSTIDCLLLPSLFEGLPFVLVEAQAAGLRCVVSSAVSSEANITGLVEFVGLQEDLSIWVQKIEKQIALGREDVTQKMIAAGYSIADSAKKIIDILMK